MSTVNREEFLQQLESVQPGLSAREIIEQSACFVFNKGKVMTYNDEISCRRVCAVDFTGAVKAEPLLALLRKLGEDEVDVTLEGEEIIVQGKRRKAGIRCEATITLPVKLVEKPEEWQKLAEGWLDAVKMAHPCVSHDQQKFKYTCIHLHPAHIEASDGFQVMRIKIVSGVKASTLVRADSLKHIVGLGVTEMSETETWLHFRNATGLTFSCRRFIEDYRDMLPLLKMKGHAINLPKGLGDAADRANVFSAETSNENQVRVSLRDGVARVKGTGASGWYHEDKKVKYDGPPLEFLIAPALLMQIVEQHNEAEIVEGKLKIDGGHWRYVTVLGQVADAKPAEEQP